MHCIYDDYDILYISIRSIIPKDLLGQVSIGLLDGKWERDSVTNLNKSIMLPCIACLLSQPFLQLCLPH